MSPNCGRYYKLYICSILADGCYHAVRYFQLLCKLHHKITSKRNYKKIKHYDGWSWGLLMMKLGICNEILTELAQNVKFIFCSIQLSDLLTFELVYVLLQFYNNITR